MLHVKLDRENGIATLTPDGALEAQDFRHAAAQIDPLIESFGKLNGLIIYVETFPGWDSFGGLAAHLRFVKDHHKEIGRIAFVTDSHIAGLAEKIGRHFIAASIKGFAYSDLAAAQTWILGDES